MWFLLTDTGLYAFLNCSSMLGSGSFPKTFIVFSKYIWCIKLAIARTGAICQSEIMHQTDWSFAHSNSATIIRIHFPGTVLSVNCNVGDQVAAGQEICVVEAMKMQNSLTSARDGTIKHIHCKAGDSIGEGDLIIELEWRHLFVPLALFTQLIMLK